MFDTPPREVKMQRTFIDERIRTPTTSLKEKTMNPQKEETATVDFNELFDNWIKSQHNPTSKTKEENPEDEQSRQPDAEDYTNPQNGHNPYQEVERLKKAMKIAIIALHYNQAPTDETCYKIAAQIRCNKPSERTIELVQELVKTNTTYMQAQKSELTNKETIKLGGKTPQKNGAQQKETKAPPKK
jgi:hypothetical protein